MIDLTNLNLTPDAKERIDDYCIASFNCCKSNLDLWRSKPNNKNVIRVITRKYYISVHDASIPSGLITLKALEKKKETPKWNQCRDHCYSPQFIGRMIMDNPETYLDSYEKFKEIFYISCTTIDITSEENRALSKLTSNLKGKEFKIFVPTDKKYQHLNIQLVERKQGRGWYHKPTNSVSNYIKTPQELLDYEKQFLIK
jgi:hypothetical protein